MVERRRREGEAWAIPWAGRAGVPAQGRGRGARRAGEECLRELRSFCCCFFWGRANGSEWGAGRGDGEGGRRRVGRDLVCTHMTSARREEEGGGSVQCLCV